MKLQGSYSLRVRMVCGAFTMIELLAVIAILVLLLGVVTPQLIRAKQSAQTASCQSGLRQWGLALLAYKNDYRGYLPREGASGQNRMAGAWYNALPPYSSAAPYSEVYDGTVLEDKKGGGYFNNWIWYCARKVVTSKNASSGKNSFHYAMNAVLNGTGGSKGFGPNYGRKSVGQYYLQGRTVKHPSQTVFMIEPSANVPNASPKRLDRERHYGDRSNFLFLDGRVQEVMGANVPRNPDEFELTEPYESVGPRLIWGPFANW